MHFAPSNLFTGEIAPRAQQLLDMGLMDTGIVGVETWDEEIVSKVLRPHDNLRMRVVMPPNAADRSMDVLASLADSLAAAQDWDAVLAYFAQSSLQMVTVTCTEKGYGIDNPAAEADAKAAELSRTRSDYGSVASLRSHWTGKLEDRATLDLEALRQHLGQRTRYRQPHRR